MLGSCEETLRGLCLPPAGVSFHWALSTHGQHLLFLPSHPPGVRRLLCNKHSAVFCHWGDCSSGARTLKAPWGSGWPSSFPKIWDKTGSHPPEVKWVELGWVPAARVIHVSAGTFGASDGSQISQCLFSVFSQSTCKWICKAVTFVCSASFSDVEQPAELNIYPYVHLSLPVSLIYCGLQLFQVRRWKIWLIQILPFLWETWCTEPLSAEQFDRN